MYNKNEPKRHPHMGPFTPCQPAKNKSIDPAERIFPPPSFLFDGSEARKMSERKINFTGVNSFRPKFEVRTIRDMVSGGKRISDLRRKVDASSLNRRVKDGEKMVER
jgi:hypothetical protein